MTASQTEPIADCTVDERGSISWLLRLPPAARPQLVLRLRPKKGHEERTRLVLDLEKTPDGRWTALQPAVPALAEGRWDAYALLEPDAERRRLRPGLRDLRQLVTGDGRALPTPVAIRIPYVTKDGFLAVRTWLRAAHAEAFRVTTLDDAVLVQARLHGVLLGDGAAVLIRHRGNHTVHTVAVHTHSDRDFSFTIDYRTLVNTGQSEGHVWDVFVQPAETGHRVRVGRLLDDLADRKAVFVYPTARVGHAEVQPYFTVDNDLSVEVRDR